MSGGWDQREREKVRGTPNGDFFFYDRLGKTMNQPETACVIAGVAAIGAIWYANRPLAPRYGPTECSARKADVAPLEGDAEWFEGEVEGAEKSMDALFETSATTAPPESDMLPPKELISKQTSLRPQVETTLGNKTTGFSALIPGVCRAETKPPPPDLLFMQPISADVDTC